MRREHLSGVGENLFVIWTSAPRPVPLAEVVEQAMHDWWEGEYKVSDAITRLPTKTAKTMTRLSDAPVSLPEKLR